MSKKKTTLKKGLLLILINIIVIHNSKGSTTLVNTLPALTNAYTNANPGDTIVVANGTYNWGAITLSNSRGNANGAWIVVKSQTIGGVTFTGSTYLKFDGTRIQINGFKFANGDAGTNPVISFRTATTSFANYSRVSNIIIDNYNTPSPDGNIENEWIGIFGIRNRVDHCNFINKSNARATIVVWYSTATFPDKSVSTFHKIDSNYFAGRSYMGGNGGETIRVGVGNNSRTDGYNIIEYNLFEGCIQTEPEIVSNKSCHNTYRYNTFKNCNGGLTLRMGKYCEAYGNYFINDDPTKTDSYGIRIIDKGHKVYNNYFEGLLGSATSNSTMRTPIVIYNGSFSSADSLNPLILNGEYLPADSAVVVFNTIVNCKGIGIRIGHNDNGNALFQPLGLKIANNAIKMSTGQATFMEPTNTSLTYFAEGNKFDAPNGLGLNNATGFNQISLLFGSRTNGILAAPNSLLDAAVNTNNYTSLLSNIDALKQTRSTVYDVGCEELNGSGSVVTHPLDSSLVGAGNPHVVIPPVTPVFSQVAPVCNGGLIILPATSLNGISGSWAPPINNQATTTYTFTPMVGSNAIPTIMTIVVLQSSSNTVTIDTTAPFIWHGNTYSSSGTYSWTGVNSVGCDSVVTLQLTIICTPIETNDTIMVANSYSWHGINYSTTGIYTWTGINSEGCDSVVHLYLTILPASLVYPNPTEGVIQINLGTISGLFTDNAILQKGFRATIMDATGRRCSVFLLDKTISQIQLNHLSNGIYFISIESADRTIRYITKMIKL